MAYVDTSQMGGGNEPTLVYVCDSGHGRVVALEPKELTERFSVGRSAATDRPAATRMRVAYPESLSACAPLERVRLSPDEPR